MIQFTIHPTAETLSFDGILNGISDPYGLAYTEKILSVNVRSQLSSVAKNFDTLYEKKLCRSSESSFKMS